ncbi:L,D-transpeptidase-like protein [Chromohalobacter marismortui]|uniref:L,D-transpeptidase-like protein n=1 Tax=Chromohalobacter marismortui TaxID=42055 RepID=A0A4V3F4F2_9GAMM|nr:MULTISPECIES: L,D-transpeptidase [Chromohalobacter]MCI0510408.1 L,D-transpeptidase [Chromohalobacter sp.]MCI0594662.1 L,D-transpeptidase [Chromohalobacter sp.]TDU25016.1 L,D-transpeptidase-like protein [Chromohalobacter marismortui]
MKRWMQALVMALAGLALLVVGGSYALAAADDEVWVLIDESTATLDIYRGDTRIERFEPVSLGRGGAARLRLKGSEMTPTGEFHINRINRDSKFRTFLGLNYPKLETARRALRAGVMSPTEYADFQEAYYRNGTPPQNTVLGGYIGIHGLGAGDPEIHRLFNWTEGCVAVTNDQIDELTRLVSIGTRVVIRGDDDTSIVPPGDPLQTSIQTPMD